MKIYPENYPNCRNNVVVDLTERSFRKCNKMVKDLYSENYNDELIHGIRFFKNRTNFVEWFFIDESSRNIAFSQIKEKCRKYDTNVLLTKIIDGLDNIESSISG